MAEPMIIAEFPNCPKCGSTGRVSELAVKATEKKTGIKQGDVFSSLEKTLFPLLPPGRVVGVTLPMLMCHYDVCAGCGLRRCVRAEIIDAPITMAPQAPPPGGGQEFPFGGPGGGFGRG